MILNHYQLDSHTAVISEPLTEQEKLELGIDSNLYAHYNEIGFSTPAGPEAWASDCFNVIVSEDADFDNIEVVLLDIVKLPQRLEETYTVILAKRLNQKP
jgi:hypothetical protein